MCLSIAINRPADVLAKGERFGFEWIVLHNGMGYRCGYVRIPKGHPWHGKDYEEISAEVYGGLTFSESDEDGAHWVGFDCMHAGDSLDRHLRASDPFRLSHPGAVIRTQEYVESECRSLCNQAAAATKEEP